MTSIRAMWVDVGAGDLKADWRYILVQYKNGKPDFTKPPQWDKDRGKVRRVIPTKG